jgi:hypothetical protein
MEILIIGGVFFGAVLGRFFKVLVLMPAGTFAIALLLVKREVAGPTLLDAFLGIGLLIGSLGLGYVTGLISTDFWHVSPPGFLAPKPPAIIDPVLADASRRERSSSAFSLAARDARARSDSIE